jgi:hypothetical protein
MLARLTEHVINEAKLGGRLAVNDAPATTAIGRAKQAMEVVSLLSNHLMGKDREIQEVVKERKRADCKTGILEKEKLLL